MCLDIYTLLKCFCFLLQYIPFEFAKLVCLDGENKTKVTRPSNIKATKVKLEYTESASSTHLTGGWAAFAQKQGLKVGVKYRFEVEAGVGIIVIYSAEDDADYEVSTFWVFITLIIVLLLFVFVQISNYFFIVAYSRTKCC